jgi:hypothetical protein
MDKNDFGYMPELTGSEAQIKWAEAIRDSLIEQITIERVKPNLVELSLQVIRDYINSHTSAAYWIEHRYGHKVKIIDLIEKARATGEHIVTEKIKQTAAAEATITPENVMKPGVVEISVSEDKISARYVKDDDFRTTVKKLGYTWNGENVAWEREIDKFSGPIVDRAAELGNKLLNLGFSVRIWDDEIRNKAIAADFSPEQDRWVKLRLSGDYKGWLSISWYDRDDKIYNAARAIKGSRWDQGCVVVKIDYADMVEDFAELYGFSFSDAARQAIDDYRVALMPAVKIEKAPEEPEKKDKLKEILNSSCEIIDDLRDEN